MKNRFRPSATAWLWLTVLITSTVWAAPDERVYVLFQPGAKAGAQAAIAASGGRVHHEFDDLRAMAITVPSTALAGLSRNPNVVAIEPDPVRELLGTASSQSTPYGIDLVQASTVQASGTTGAGVKVGVIDSGVHRVHADFVGLTLTGEPAYGDADQRTWYRDLDSHGTHVTGTIAAANNSLGVVGTAPGVAIHMVKVFGDVGQWIYSSDLLAAARAAANQGCKIINMSLGGGRASPTERRGLDSLYTNGVLLIAAAGNDGTTALSYPASYDSVVSVAAVDHTKLVADFSQKNSQVELAAPGVSVLSTTSYSETVGVTVAGTSYPAMQVEFAKRGTATAALVDGGLGTATNAAWSGKVVLVRRGEISFYDKVRNVQLSGGVACIIANNVAGALHATLGDGNSSTIPAVGVSQADGDLLLARVGQSTTVSSTFVQPDSGYSEYDGTSMATPHVSGVAALLWSKYPQATNAQIRQALGQTAEDLGTAGRDTSYGHGLIRANAALVHLGTLVSGSPPPPPTDTTPPVISNVTSRSTSKNGSFEITWATNESARSSVTINGSSYHSTTLTTAHKFTFRGTRGATYTYTVFSTDAANNTAQAGPFTHQN